MALDPMTVRRLIEFLHSLPQDAPVCPTSVYVQYNTDAPVVTTVELVFLADAGGLSGFKHNRQQTVIQFNPTHNLECKEVQ